MPKILRTEGIVLKRINFRETSRIVSFFSKRFGRLQLLAKGIRKPGSRFGASMEPFTHSSVIFYKRETREIYTVSDSQILHSFDRLRHNIPSFTLASNILNFISITASLEERHEELFRLSLRALKLLEIHPEEILLWGYVIKALALLGYFPELSRCVGCQEPTTSVLFSVSQGGIVCERCKGHGLNLDLSRIISTLRSAQKEELQELVRLKMPSSQKDEIGRFFRQFIRHHLNVEASFHLPSESWRLR